MIKLINVQKCPICFNNRQYPEEYSLQNPKTKNFKINKQCNYCITARREKIIVINSDPFYKKYIDKANIVMHGISHRSRKKGLPKPTIDVLWILKRYKKGKCCKTGIFFYI